MGRGVISRRGGPGPVYDLVVLGGGSAGLVSAVIAGEVGARVALVERAPAPGGDCLWTGCVPSKALVAAAGLAERFRRADRVGLEPVEPAIDFARVMGHVRGARERIAPQDSAERLRRSGVEVIEGEGRFSGPRMVHAGGRELRARSVLIATGSRPVVPDVPGLAAAAPLTTDTLWEIEEQPQRLVVIGGAATGCELSQAFARLGTRVTLVEAEPTLLAREEPEARELVARRLSEDGVDVRVGAGVARVEAGEVHLEGAARQPVAFDAILVAAGRAPDVGPLGLEAAGVELASGGAVGVDSRLRTSAEGVYAAGDVTGWLPFTHVAAYHARVAVVNALFGLRTRVDHSAVPRVTFTDPEVAHVGMSEAGARERWGRRARVDVHSYAELDRAIVAGEAEGFAKLVSDPRGRLVGATIAAPAAGEAIAEMAARVASRGAVTGLAEAVHAYPTFAEGPVRAAEERALGRWTSPAGKALTRTALAARRMLAARP